MVSKRDQGARGIRVERANQDALYGAHKDELRRKGGFAASQALALKDAVQERDAWKAVAESRADERDELQSELKKALAKIAVFEKERVNEV